MARKIRVKVDVIESPLKNIVQAHEAHINNPEATFAFPVDKRSWEEAVASPSMLRNMTRSDMERYWYIGYKNDIRVCYNHKGPYVDTGITKQRELIGNRFESFEDAEKALEKLKAWKRLKDKGFEFRWVDKEQGTIKYAFFLKYPNLEIDRFDYKDLDLLFGGEDD